MLFSKERVLQVFSFLNLVRVNNLVIILIAQYLSSIFILSPNKNLSSVILDPFIFLLSMASLVAIAAGYIINDFYDEDKDLINMPQKTIINFTFSKNKKLILYFTLNFISILVACLISIKAVLFFSLYIFLMWFYSHKIKKHIFGFLLMVILYLFPFFSIFLYYKNFDSIIIYHAIFLFILLLLKEVIKSLCNMDGDKIYGYKTLPLIYGLHKTKMIIIIISTGLLLYSLFISQNSTLGKMKYFFYFTILASVFISFIIKKLNTKQSYLILHLFIKVLIFLGVMSVTLIDYTYISNPIINFLK